VNPRQVLPVAYAIGRTGLLRPPGPVELVRMVQTFRRWGASLATAAAVAALRAPHQMAVVDDEGGLSWHELDIAANAVAGLLVQRGVRAGSNVALMCRNDRYFVVAALAVSKVGGDLVLLNTEFAPAQLGGVLQRESIAAAIFDGEFARAFDEVGFQGPRVDHLDVRRAGLCAARMPPEPPRRPGRIVFMTSGTTGTPKGAQRNTLAPPTNIVMDALTKLPLRVREPVVVAPPLFHLLGFGFFGLALLLQGTLVLRRTFDPEAVLAAVARERAATLVVVPVMLRRILALPATTRLRHDTSSLRVILCSGSTLGAELALASADAFGDILYNFYGSTEVGWVAMAQPSDLRAAPGTVGRPPMGTRIAILDGRGRRLPTGKSGRIFVGSAMAFDGYTGGGGKEVVDGLMSTGDIGHLDGEGRLFVHGRADDMIVSGGENVFPEEVENLLRSHAAVADAAVVGVDDEEMGQRLAAFVVPAPGSTPTTFEIKAFVRSRLARFKVPRDVTFVDRIPRNPTGKVLRRRLLELGCDPTGPRESTEAERWRV